MRNTKSGLAAPVIALLALVAGAGSANAAVIIKTFRCAICVTDAKHPDACKNVTADGRVIVSEDALAGLEGEIGQGATIMKVASMGGATRSGDQERRHRRHLDPDQPASPQ